jgi:nickel-dependent lactate racemase
VKLNLALGNTTEQVTVPDRNLLGVLEPARTEPPQDIETSLAQATEAAAGYLESPGPVLVLVNDYTRPTPNQWILEKLEPLLAGRDVRFMVCLGTHRVPTETELCSIFGSGFYDRHHKQILNHDSRDKPSLLFQGKTRFGTGVWFNRELVRAERIIAINSVEPHYFAGFTGGRKSFLPGVAGYDTICQNHNMVVHPDSAVFALAGNPVHEDMEEAARMFACPVFSIQVVVDQKQQPHSLYHGDLSPSFEAGTRDCRSVYAVPIKRQANIVLSILRPPCDINFYQSQRAPEFARSALKQGGIHITASACHNGVGSDAFIRVFDECKAPSDVLGLAEDSRAFGWHKSARLARMMETFDLYTVVGVDDAFVKQAFMHPFGSMQAALDAAMERIGTNTMFRGPRSRICPVNSVTASAYRWPSDADTHSSRSRSGSMSSAASNCCSALMRLNVL